MTLRCLFVDFDSYFASVEQYDDPRLRGRPVGVVPVMADSTCCLAASYEAKAVGVKTGTGVREAREKDPGDDLLQPPAVATKQKAGPLWNRPLLSKRPWR